MLWRIVKWWRVLTGRVCRICNADLRNVSTCGICGKGNDGVPFRGIGGRLDPPRV